ncbi:MAG: phosphoribosyltransferase [Chamaesiphon sp.]
MSSIPLFSDRIHAGEQLAQSIFTELAQLKAAGVFAQPIVYALPRGGIPVAIPIVRQLDCPLDILVAKKITRTQNPELAIGAVTADGHVLWSGLKPFRKNQHKLREAALIEAQEKAQAQLALFSPSCLGASPEGAIAILVDDGIATGMTIAAAAASLKVQNPAQVWISAPVAPAELMNWLHQWCDRAIVLETPHPFLSVSRFYAEFPQVETSVALAYLQEHNQAFLSGQKVADQSSG